MVSDELMLKVENVSKVYKLGEIGGTTLRDELQRSWAKIRKKDDPTKKIGAKNYNRGEKFKALDNVSFEVKKGERIGIIGHNGAGKSTLLKLISRVTGPTEGKIYLNGRVASMLEVGTGFHPELTGRENIYMNGAILGMTKKEIDAKIENIIEFSEVRQFIDTPVKRYSSGMYVKLAFSVAAHLDSEIVIMDEVLAVGDVAFQNKCLKKMKDISEQDNRTILYVSHNMNTIRQLCDKVLVLSKGKVDFFGNVEKGISNYLCTNNLTSNNIIDTSNITRSSHINQKIVLETIEMIDVDEAIYERGKNINIKLKWRPLASVKKVRLRIGIQTSGDVPVGLSISDVFAMNAAINEEYQNVVTMDTTILAEGTYFLSICFFQSDDSNNAAVLDLIPRAITFRIIEDKTSNSTIAKWDPMYYGFIHYPDIKIK